MPKALYLVVKLDRLSAAEIEKWKKSTKIVENYEGRMTRSRTRKLIEYSVANDNEKEETKRRNNLQYRAVAKKQKLNDGTSMDIYSTTTKQDSEMSSSTISLVDQVELNALIGKRKNHTLKTTKRNHNLRSNSQELVAKSIIVSEESEVISNECQMKVKENRSVMLDQTLAKKDNPNKEEGHQMSSTATLSENAPKPNASSSKVACYPFIIDEVIWGKIRGSTHWPAKVLSIGKRTFKVEWFNDYRTTQLYLSQMYKFCINFHKFSLKFDTVVGLKDAAEEALLYEMNKSKK